jgi:hypothetical protein
LTGSQLPLTVRATERIHHAQRPASPEVMIAGASTGVAVVKFNIAGFLEPAAPLLLTHSCLIQVPQHAVPSPSFRFFVDSIRDHTLAYAMLFL